MAYLPPDWKAETDLLHCCICFLPFDQIHLWKWEREENTCLSYPLTPDRKNRTKHKLYEQYLEAYLVACGANTSLVNLYRHMVHLYRWTKIFSNKWLIYILGRSIYPVHGWSIAINLSSADRQWDLSSESQLHGPSWPTQAQTLI